MLVRKGVELIICGYISGYMASTELPPLPKFTPTIDAMSLRLSDMLLLLDISGASTTFVL